MTDWKKLEDDVDNAIKKGCPINFDTKKPEERRYIQKCAEIYISLYGILLSIAFFAVAIGIAYILLFFQDNKMWPIAILGSFLLIIGYLLTHIPPTYLATSNMKNCRRIILDAEKIEETTQKQEKVESIAEKKERKKGFFDETIRMALFQNPVMPVIILDADFTDLRICCLKFASIGVNRILKITGK
jgi:hypothetical protein